MTNDEKEMYLMLHNWIIDRINYFPKIAYFPSSLSIGTFHLDYAYELAREEDGIR
jgi:hypothetical protein